MSSTDVTIRPDGEPILEMKGISKAFGHVQALDEVNFELYPAEVLALVGDNGAGKSTLIKILSGVYQKDTGEIYIDGEQVEWRFTCRPTLRDMGSLQCTRIWPWLMSAMSVAIFILAASPGGWAL